MKKISLAKLHPYSKSFPSLYEKEEKRILSKIGMTDIHHVGSTSVKGLMGKGIIDILIGVENPEEAVLVEQKLHELGYITKFENKEEGIFLSSKEETGLKDYHIHILKNDDQNYRENILFRDYLKSNKNARIEYEKVKQDILEKVRGIRKKYTKRKGDYIKKILKGLSH